MGRGKGPGEIVASISSYAQLPDGGWFFVGATLDGYIYNSNFIQKRWFFYDRGTSDTRSFENPFMYTQLYSDLIIKEHGGYLYYNVWSGNRTLSIFDDQTQYFRNVRILSQLNLATAKVERVFGRYSPFYDNNRGLNLFIEPIFDIDNHGNFYLTFYADPMIYVYDKNFSPLYSTGFQGKRMNLRYPNVSSVSEYQKHHHERRAKYGYYRQIFYVNETGFLFRPYARADYQPYDGLQIYKDVVLIGDVNVPKGFKMIGYSKPYYYGFCGLGEDDEDENIIIFRFKF
jgi:hypothetical protein